MRSAWTRETPIGPMTLVEEDGALIQARFGTEAEDAKMARTPLLERAFLELDEYFRGGRTAFTVPLEPRGTPFQQRCWAALMAIPFGQTRTYAEQAELVGNPRACRAVGMANRANPLPVFIPCHRVIGKNGALTGYAGGLNVKETLLELERNLKG